MTAASIISLAVLAALLGAILWDMLKAVGFGLGYLTTALSGHWPWEW